jgi:iron complex outermembrane receptor protein
MFCQGERTNGDLVSQQSDPYHIVPDYTVFNGRLTYMSEDAKWNVALAVENMFDKFYWITLGPERSSNGVTPIYNRSGVPSRDREFAVTLRRNF